jgi:general secretion pathway protein D
MKFIPFRLHLSMLALVGAFLSGFAQPAPPASSPQSTLPEAVSNPGAMVGPIMLRDESIDQVLVLLERWTGRTILRPQTMPAAAVTLSLRESITKAEAIQAVETLLNLNGIALTPLGNRFLKATPLSLAKSEAPEFIEGSTLGMTPSGRVASKMFQLSFLRIGEFMPQMQSLMNPAAGSPPIVFEKTNAALITDSISNLQRIETLVSKLDQPMLNGLQPKFYPLSYAKASEVVNKIRTLFSGPLQSQIGSATSFNADDNTNQIILISDSRQHAFFDELVAKLDVRSNPNTRNEVIPLKHAAAKDVAAILSQLVTGQNNAAKSVGSDANRPLTSANVNAPQPAGPPAPTAAPAAAAVVANLGVSLDSSNQFSPMLTILSEERSNAIVVSGTVDDVRLINELVAKIDVLLAQVRIEVVIAEVTLSDNASSGIGALGLQIIDGKLVGFNSNGPGYSIGGAQGATIGTTTDLARFSAGTTDLTAAIGLSSSPRKTNTVILSQPNIMTTHNKKGTIFVGESRPTISSYLNDSTTGTTGGIGGYRSTVGQQEIGIELIVTPLIGTDGSVQLEIEQNVDDVIGEIEIDGNPQPQIGKRNTNSFVSARSGEIIVIGGLQRTSKSKRTNRLGPIPILGDLFGSRSREDTRTDLVFFLRPTVLTNTAADTAEAIERVENFPEKQREPVREALKLGPKK